MLYKKSDRFSKKDSSIVVNEMFEIIKQQLEQGGKIKISGFGNFIIRYKKQRIGRNPLTSEEIMISARHVVLFKPSPLLKKRINNKTVE